MKRPRSATCFSNAGGRKKTPKDTLGAAGDSQAAAHFDGAIWWNYVKALAADDMEGRETGIPGLRKAQERQEALP